jgi:acyl phosphate:glycerol-3-phosphate acyltransferase
LDQHVLDTLVELREGLMREFLELALMPLNLLFYFFAYALAATPTAYLVAKIVHRVDAKKNPLKIHSSLYVWRTMSKKSGLLVFVLNLLKGVIPCGIAYSLQVPTEIIALIGLVAVFGHCYSIYIGFGGGFGTATAAGALLFVYWPASVFGMLFFLLLLVLGFRADRASLISGAIGIGVLIVGVTNKIVWLIVALMAVIILLRHRSYRGIAERP